MGIPGGTVVKNLPARAADTRGTGSIPGLERSPGEEHSSILASQHSFLENSTDRGDWWATVQGITKDPMDFP